MTHRFGVPDLSEVVNIPNVNFDTFPTDKVLIHYFSAQKYEEITVLFWWQFVYMLTAQGLC